MRYGPGPHLATADGLGLFFPRRRRGILDGSIAAPPAIDALARAAEEHPEPAVIDPVDRSLVADSASEVGRY